VLNELLSHTANASDCQAAGWHFFNSTQNDSYCFLTTTVSKEDANAMCQTLGGSTAMLVNFGSKSEFDQVFQLAK
jgi:hypothetical protein